VATAGRLGLRHHILWGSEVDVNIYRVYTHVEVTHRVSRIDKGQEFILTHPTPSNPENYVINNTHSL
jgi:hypothetical protein